MQNSESKTYFSCLFSCGKENTVCCFIKFISFVNVLEIVKQLSTEETQPIPKTSLLHQLKGKAFFINYL